MRRRTTRIRDAMFLAMVSMAGGQACSGDPTDPGGTAHVASITVTPSQATLVSVGESAVLSATARDASGEPLEVTLDWSSSNSAAVSVAGDGRVTAVSNGTSTITASAQGVSASATVIVSQAIETFEVLQGDAQVGGVGQPLDTLIRFRARDPGGSPAVGIPLSLAVIGGGSVDAPVATTSADGTAEIEWTLGSTPGPNELEVRRQGGDSVLALITATGFADLPASMTLLDGNNQMELPGLQLPEPIRVVLVDRFNNPVPGVPVEFSAMNAGDVVEPAEVFTDLDGIAEATWTLGPGLGARAARALVRDSVVFDLTNLPGSPVTFNAAAVDFALTGVAPQSTTVGATVTLNGTGFGAALSDNVVRFDGVVAPVVSVTPTALVVQVPSFGCAAARTRTIQVVRGENSASIAVPVNPEGLLSLDVGEHAMISDPASFCLQFAQKQSGAATYLIGMTATRPLSATTSFTFTANSPLSPGVVAAARQGSSVSSSVVPVRTVASPEAKLREWERSFLRTRPDAARTRVRAPVGAAARAGASSVLANNISVGQDVTFRVPNILGDACNAFVLQPATIIHVGEGLVIAIPEVPDIALPALLANPDVVAALTMLQSRVATVRDRIAAYIGELSNAFDEDGRLVVLLTPVMSGEAAPPVFGTVVDLVAQSTCASSNEQAIVYVTVDDVDYAQPQQAIATLTSAMSTASPDLVHELTHLVQHLSRMLAGIGVPLPSWIAEGQAEVLTEVVGRVLRGDVAGMDYGASVVTADQTAAAFYLPRFDRLAYLFGWDGANGRVAGAPEQCSLFGFGGLASACRPESAPGAAWSFARYITDRIAQGVPGGEPALHRLLTLSADAAAIGTFLEAQTGSTAAELMVEWAMMLYADGRVVAQAAPALQLRSWNLSNIFASMPAARRLEPDAFPFSAFTRSGSIVGGGTVYVTVSAGNGHDALAVQLADALGRAVSGGMGPYLWVVRLQ